MSAQVDALNALLVSRPYRGRPPKLVSEVAEKLTAEKQKALFLSEKSVDLLVWVAPASIATVPEGTNRDVITANLSVVLSAPLNATHLRTSLAMHEWFARTLRSDPTLSGLAIHILPQMRLPLVHHSVPGSKRVQLTGGAELKYEQTY